ncbi:uncharacterized protein [Triticum aestivum]|uniref:uncharacterized protein n=1 Tax=Triticum aestivum TaxID=4565 RepID=UPI001D01F1DF|nr:uncharacterized protein LOC123104464 [Triticum aestivum]
MGNKCEAVGARAPPATRVASGLFLFLRCSSPSLSSRVFLPIHSHPGRARRHSCRQLDAPRFESCVDHRRRIHPSPWPPTARGALVALSAGNWKSALSMATTARASLVHHDQAAIGHGGDESVLEPEGCWNQCPDLLEPARGCAARLTPRRRKLHPVARRAASNVVQTPELQPVTRGAARRGWPFLLMFFFPFYRTKFLFLLEPMYCFAGTDVIFCFVGCRALKCFMSFLLEPKFGFAGSVI